MSARKRKTNEKATAHRPPDVPEALPPRHRLFAARLLIVIALAVSAYLAFLSVTGSKAVGCGPDSGCDHVLSSRWSSWFGIPVSIFALLVDAGLLAGTFLLDRGATPAQQRRGWAIVLPGAVLVAGAAAWFVFLQLAVMRQICPYCMVAHLAGSLAAGTLLLSMPKPAPPEKAPKADRTALVTRPGRRRAVGFALVGLGGLVVGQMVYAPKTYIEISQNIGTNNATPVPSVLRGTPATSERPVTAVAPSQTAFQTSATTRTAPMAVLTNPPPMVPMARSPAQRPLPLYNGRFFIDVADEPTIGSPTNPYVAVALQDFTCSHCRELHPHLVEAQQIFSNQLVIVTLSMPFDPNCNPVMKRHNPKHTNACEYARLSLAVFRANRARQHDYDEFLFTGEKPPPILAAREKAAQLVGEKELGQALTDPWIDQHIRLGIALYETASQAGHASLPQLMVGSQIAVGILPPDVIMDLLAKNLGLTVNASPATGRSP